MGFGGTPDSALSGLMQKLLNGGFFQSVRLVVDRLSFAADPEDPTACSRSRSPPRRSTRRWCDRTGQVAGRRFHWDAVVGDEVVVRITVNWLMGEENLDPAWSFGPAGKRYEMEVRWGHRTLLSSRSRAGNLRRSRRDCRATAVVATAAHCVNAVPATCAAAPGIATFFDLPPITGRAAPPALSR